MYLDIEKYDINIVFFFFEGYINVLLFYEIEFNVIVYFGELVILRCIIENLGLKIVSFCF